MPRARLADVLRAAASWQGLETVSVSRWGDATDDLAAALPEARRHEAGAAEPAAPALDDAGRVAMTRLAMTRRGSAMTRSGLA